MGAIRKELGEILQEADLISAAQLNEALALQKTYGERLASILVRKRVLTEKFAVTYLGRQVGVPGVDLSRSEIDLSLLDIVPPEICERHLVFPIKIEGTRLQLAMADPTDQVLVGQIEFETGVRLAPMIALESSIKNALIEARRARRVGQKTITPNIQKAVDDAGASAAPSAAPAASTGGAPRVVEPTPVLPAEDKERAIFETLAGAELGVKTPPAAPERIPAVEEMQTILVAEDDDAVRGELEQLLKQRRYRVLTTKSGREALTRVREAVPDLVVLDGMLPEVHGFEICRQLKSSERFRHIPVVLLAPVGLGWRFAADVKERYGADDLLERPLEPADFMRRVDLLLNRAPSGLAADSEAAARKHLKDGVVALKQSRYEAAVEALGRGLAIDQFNDMLHYYLAMAHEKLDQPFHAIDHYEKAVQLNPDFYDAIVSLANLYQRQEFRRKAVEMWELALAATKEDSVRSRIKEHLLSLL